MKRIDVSSGNALTLLLLAVLLFVGNAVSHAHGILSTETGTGKVKFTFENGTPLAKGHISVLDKEGKEIATGQTDPDGVFDCSAYENSGTISVTDSHGHHRTHEIGSRDQDHSSPHHHHDHGHEHHPGDRTMIVIVVGVLLAVAAAFYFGNRRKNGQSVE